jgi:mxaA protein
VRAWLSGLLLWALAPVAPGEEPAVVLRLERSVERPFAHLIGDLIHTEVLIEVARPWQLDPASLGGPGARAYWLDLVEQTVEAQALPDRNRYLLRQTYQSFYFSREAKALEVPPPTVRLVGGGDPLAVTLPALEFTISPIQETAGLRRDEHGYYIRPDARPPLRDPAPHRDRALAWGLAALLPAALLAWQAGWFSRRLRPFARAWRAVRRLSREGVSLTALREAMLQLHRALDETAGRPVFLADLPDFLAGFPNYARLRERLEAFYADSRMVFFGTREEAMSRVAERFAEVRELAAQLARLEVRA